MNWRIETELNELKEIVKDSDRGERLIESLSDEFDELLEEKRDLEDQVEDLEFQVNKDKDKNDKRYFCDLCSCEFSFTQKGILLGQELYCLGCAEKLNIKIIK